MKQLKGLEDYEKSLKEIKLVKTVQSWYNKLYLKGYSSIYSSRIVSRAKRIFLN